MPYVLHHFSRSLDFDPERLSAMGEAYDRSVRSFVKLPRRPEQKRTAPPGQGARRLHPPLSVRGAKAGRVLRGHPGREGAGGHA